MREITLFDEELERSNSVKWLWEKSPTRTEKELCKTNLKRAAYKPF